MLLEGTIQPLSPCKNQYFSNFFLVGKRDQGQQTSNKFEISEEFYPIPAFQNLNTEFIAKYAPEERLHLQAGPTNLQLRWTTRAKRSFCIKGLPWGGGGSMVFSGEILPQKCSIIGTSEATNSFIYKIQNNYIRFIYGQTV